MKRRSYDENGDYAINSFIEDGPATVQAVYSKLKLWRGEWFLNGNLGVPYMESILGKPRKLHDIERTIKRIILSVEGVSRLTSFTIRLDRNTRHLTISYSARTIYDEDIGDVLGVSASGV
jgi:hypothetical protein